MSQPAPELSSTPVLEPNATALGLDPDSSWSDWFRFLLVRVLFFAGQNPWQFVYYVLLALSPLFIISAALSYKLIKEIDSKDRDKKKRSHKQANLARSRGRGPRAKSD